MAAFSSDPSRLSGDWSWVTAQDSKHRRLGGLWGMKKAAGVVLGSWHAPTDPLHVYICQSVYLHGPFPSS